MKLLTIIASTLILAACGSGDRGHQAHLAASEINPGCPEIDQDGGSELGHAEILLLSGPQALASCLSQGGWSLQNQAAALELLVPFAGAVMQLGSFEAYAWKVLQEDQGSLGPFSPQEQRMTSLLRLYGFGVGLGRDPSVRIANRIPQMAAAPWPDRIQKAAQWFQSRAGRRGQGQLVGESPYGWLQATGVGPTEKLFATYGATLEFLQPHLLRGGDVNFTLIRKLNGQRLGALAAYYGNGQQRGLTFRAQRLGLALQVVQAIPSYSQLGGRLGQNLYQDFAWQRLSPILQGIWHDYQAMPSGTAKDQVYQALFADGNDSLAAFLTLVLNPSGQNPTGYSLSGSAYLRQWQNFLQTAFAANPGSLLPQFAAIAVVDSDLEITKYAAAANFDDALAQIYRTLSAADQLHCLVNFPAQKYADQPHWALLTEPCAPLGDLLSGILGPMIKAFPRYQPNANQPRIFAGAAGSHEAMKYINATIGAAAFVQSLPAYPDFFSVGEGPAATMDHLLCRYILMDQTFAEALVAGVDVSTISAANAQRAMEALAGKYFAAARLYAQAGGIDYHEMSAAVFAPQNLQCSPQVLSEAAAYLSTEGRFLVSNYPEYVEAFVNRVFQELWSKGDSLLAPMWKLKSQQI